jgi:hypothetical protein
MDGEELGVEHPIIVGPAAPAFLTVTTTVGRDPGHTDVSLWFIIEGSRDMQLTIDEVEFRDVRWWSLPDVTSAEGKLRPALPTVHAEGAFAQR